MSKCIYTQEQYDKIIEERNKLANDNFKLNLKLVENIKENQRLKDFIYKRENCNEWLTIKDNENLQYEIKQLKQQLAEKDKILEQHKIDQLYLELLFTRLQWIHKEADACREEKERFGGIEDMALDSVWRVLDLQKHECCGYEEMAELDDGIGYIAEDKLLITIEHDLNFKATRTENEIIDEIKKLTRQHEDKGE